MREKIKSSAETDRKKSSDSPEQQHTQVSASSKYADPLNSLHLAYGNRALQNMLDSGVLRAKLRIGAPNDEYEQEADRVAEQVMRMPEPGLQRKPG